MADAEYEADGDESNEEGDENGNGIVVVAPSCDDDVSLLARLCSGRMTPSSSTARMHRQNIVITPLKL